MRASNTVAEVVKSHELFPQYDLLPVSFKMITLH